MSASPFLRVRSCVQIVPDPNGRRGEMLAVEGTTGRVVRMSAAAAALLRRLDGSRSLEDVLQSLGKAANGDARSAARQTSLHRLILELEAVGILENVAPTAAPQAPRPQASRDLLARLRRGISWTVPPRHATPLDASPHLVWMARIGLVVVIAMGSAVVGNAGRLGLFYHTARPADAAWLLALTFVGGGVVHELAHAIVARRYRAVPRRAGFAFHWLVPVFYVEIDGWWALRRPERIAVSMAGIVADLVMTLTLLTAALLPMVPPWVSQACTLAGAVSFVRAFWNLVPFLKFDGYYVLCDILAISNLRERAFLALVSLLPQVGRRFAAYRPASRRAQVAAVVYSGTAIIFVVGTLVNASGNAYAWLHEGIGPTAAALVVGAAVLASLGTAVVTFTQGLDAAARWAPIRSTGGKPR